MGIANYGGFISGLETIRGQVSYVSTKLVESAKSPFEHNNVKATYQNNAGALSLLHRLFQKVQKGDLTPEQATIEAERILGAEAKSSLEFMQKLNEALKNAPKYPKQELLFQEESELNSSNDERKKREPLRTPTPKPDIPTNQFRVEIWRESKRDKKNIKISQL